MKRSSFFSLLVCSLGFATLADRASADVMFTLTDVELVVGNSRPAGTLSGTFTLSTDLTRLLAADITASGATVNGFTYAPTTYQYQDSSSLEKGNVTGLYTAHLPRYYQLDIGGTHQLRLIFDGALSDVGKTRLFQGAYEWQRAAGSRTVASGWAVVTTPAPEPSTFLLAAASLPILILAARKRREAAV